MQANHWWHDTFPEMVEFLTSTDCNQGSSKRPASVAAAGIQLGLLPDIWTLFFREIGLTRIIYQHLQESNNIVSYIIDCLFDRCSAGVRLYNLVGFCTWQANTNCDLRIND
jgi:hypothetical protein